MPHLGKRCSSRAVIQTLEFWEALRSVWHPVNGHGGGRSSGIGLAVSGGLDSMALARLCAGLRNKPPHESASTLRFHAFIVDHKARADSAEEALLVASRLQKLGLESTILTLEWPSGVIPAQLPNFETQARKLRYQALGKACLDHHIRSLLLAHHEDDQAETVFFRLSNGQRGTGLQGMQPWVNIPECWGRHGLHESGIREEQALSATIVEPENSYSSKRKPGGSSLPPGRRPWPKVGFEDGGIKIFRPLLGFCKNRLRTTCTNYGVQWVEDATNWDVRKTPRNAIRHLLRNATLPRALQKPSLLSLAERMHQRSLDQNARAEKLFQDCDISMFDTRSGGLVVRLPDRVEAARHIPEAHLAKHMRENERIASLLLRQILRIVSPMEIISLQCLEFLVRTIFPELNDPEATRVDKRLQASSFSACNVLFERLDLPLPKRDAAKPKKLNAKVSLHTKLDPKTELDPEFIWVLSRQPYPSNRPPPQTLILSLPPQPSSQPPLFPWHLWDGRYWIRVLAPSYSSTLVIRPLTPRDLSPFRTALSEHKNRRTIFDTLLKTAAPGKIRWTLPVIAEVGTPGQNGKVLAVPTFGMEAGTSGLRWEIRYKKVVLGRRKG